MGDKRQALTSPVRTGRLSEVGVASGSGSDESVSYYFRPSPPYPGPTK